MSKKSQIVVMTPIFAVLSTISCLLFAKIDEEHKQHLLQGELLVSQKNAIGRLNENEKLLIKNLTDEMAHTSFFSFFSNSRVAQLTESIKETKVRGFDLLACLLQDDEIKEGLTLVKESKKRADPLLRLISEELLKEYESSEFFVRARLFANKIGVSEEAVITSLKGAIEQIKFDQHLSNIEALIDFLTYQSNQNIEGCSFSLL